MNKETVKGEAEKLGGKVKEATGDLTDNDRLRSEGQADQVKGGAHKVIGRVKDAARDAADRLKQQGNH